MIEGQDVIICGTGPSLRGFDFGLLEGRTVIAINEAHRFCPGAAMLWWSDADYWRRAWPTLMAHEALIKETLDLDYREGELPPGVARLTVTGPHGFDPEPGHIRHGHNSAFAAMHRAIALGARSIVLLGVDMCHAPDGRAHFHTSERAWCPQDTFENLMVPAFATLVPALAERGISVLNGSPESRLEIWPRMTPAEALAGESLDRTAEPG